MPHPKSVGFRGCCGSNYYTTEWKNLAVRGFGVGFDIGGEHVYCESLSALYNIYGFAFDCYEGKDRIDTQDEAPRRGICMYPVTCVNLLDEHNFHLPKFGNASHCGKTLEKWGSHITITGMNIQWPNTCPGCTDRSKPEFYEGRNRATESQIGGWRGSIEYVIDHVEEGGHANIVMEPYFEEGHGVNVRVRNIHERLDK